MNDKNGMRKVFFLGLSLVLTVIIYISGVFLYRTGLGSVRQGIIRVELAGFIENTRYALHFGKDIDTFYRMNELLNEALSDTPDVDGLYVVSSDGRELFATDGRELSAAVLSMKDGNRTEGNQFYTAALLDEGGSATLLSRSEGTQVLLGQSDFMFRFLLFCILGFLVSAALLLLVLGKGQAKGRGRFLPGMIVILWVITASSVMNYGVYGVYRESIDQMEERILDSVNADLRRVSDMGIKDGSIAPLDSYFARYTEAADEVQELSMQEDGTVLVTMEPFAGRFVLRYLLLTGVLVLLALLTAWLFGRHFPAQEAEPAAQTDHAEMPAEKNSIKRRLKVLVLAISATALAIVSTIAVVLMLSIRSQSETALINETKSNLNVIALDSASIVEEMMVRYRDYVDFFASVTGKVSPRGDAAADAAEAPIEDLAGGGYEFVTIKSPDAGAKAGYEARRSRILASAALLLPYLEDEDNDIFSIYWGSRDGFLSMLSKTDYLPDPDTVYDFQQSEWYRKAERERTVIFTGVYTDAFGEGKVISCAAPYYDESGEFAGVLGIDIAIADICARLEELDLGEGAYAFIVDSAENVISFEGDYVSLEEAEKLDAEARERLLRSDGAVFERNGIYYTGAKVAICDWTVGIHAPAGQELQMVRAIDYQIRTAIVIFIFVFAMIMAIVLLIINRTAAGITDPIIELEADVRKISGGDLEHRARVLTDDEVGRLARSFNDMSKSLKEYVEDIREMTAKQERLGAELSVATRIQADMLPSDFTAYADRREFDIYASMTPAKEVGGDFYDFFLIDEDHLGLVMADVSGKGVPAALFMVVTRTLIRNCALTGASPAKILEKVNNELCENNKELLFVTVWIGILDLATGVLLTADAGHEYPAIRRGSEGSYELLKTEHYPPLGTMEGNSYVEVDVTMNAGDALFLYTDGASDAKDPAGKKLGVDTLVSYMNAHADRTAEEQIKLLRGQIDTYMDGTDPFDDITLLCVRYLGK